MRVISKEDFAEFVNSLISDTALNVMGVNLRETNLLLDPWTQPTNFGWTTM